MSAGTGSDLRGGQRDAAGAWPISGRETPGICVGAQSFAKTPGSAGRSPSRPQARTSIVNRRAGEATRTASVSCRIQARSAVARAAASWQAAPESRPTASERRRILLWRPPSSSIRSATAICGACAEPALAAEVDAWLDRARELDRLRMGHQARTGVATRRRTGWPLHVPRSSAFAASVMAQRTKRPP